MANTGDIKRRIKSIKNTKKITKAMEMVASSKMRKAVNAVLASRNYADLAWNLILNVAHTTDTSYHDLLNEREEQKHYGVILLSSNRGLCGSFNQHIIKKVTYYLEKRLERDDITISFICIGKKGARYLAKKGYVIDAEFEKPDIVQNIEEVRPVIKMAIEGYLEKKYDKVLVFYTDFISSLKQESRYKILLPIEPTPDERLGVVDQEHDKSNIFHEHEYIFEPNPKEILDNLLPRLLEIQIYQAMLESNASEHSARMMAMRNASDAAGDMLEELTLTYNQARQSAITQEIAEISGGKAALE